MKIHHFQKTRLLAAILSPIVFVSCADNFDDPAVVTPGERTAFEFAASIEQDNGSRADESGFADGDRFGAYVVNYYAGEPGTLALTGNQVNNVAIAYDAGSASWIAASGIYWRDSSTPVDVYGYYPFNNGLGDVEAYRFEVRSDQSIPAADGDMGAYEASDFLWAKSARVTPGTKINLPFTHRLAGVKVTLQKGSGFTDEEWEKLPRIVSVDNTVRTASIDLSTGVATPTGSFDRNVVMNPDAPDSYRAVIVPQTVAAGRSTIGITIDGVNYAYTRDGGMTYAAGKLHAFTLRVDKKEQGGGYTVTLTGESILPWEADSSSHDFVENSYVVVHCPEPGKLRESLAAAGIDIATVKNLKITGTLNEDDFYLFNRYDIQTKNYYSEFLSLVSINLKNAKLACEFYSGRDVFINYVEVYVGEDVLPPYAFYGLKNLQRIILPDNLIKLGFNSLCGIGLNTTLIIPESVTEIGIGAFSEIGEGGTIILPSALEKIEDSAFSHCRASVKVLFSNKLKYIGSGAFGGANIIGAFSLPESLEYLGKSAFGGTEIEGEIIVPITLTEIPGWCFCEAKLKEDVKVRFHDGITKIGESAFEGIKFGGNLALPPNLKEIGDNAFFGCKFSGELNIPTSVQNIGSSAFHYSNLSGTLNIPDNIDVISEESFCNTALEKVILGNNVELVGNNAFIGNSELRYVEIGKNVAMIGDGAFAYCPGIATFVSLAKEPPALGNNVFFGFDPVHCTLEVPEESVDLYRNAAGWRDFTRISPHRELVFGFSSQKCLNKGITRSAILTAEGPWRVKEAPDWVRVAPDHGDYREELTVTVEPLPSGSGDREGRIVFELIGKDYTADCEIIQYDYEHPEDSEIRLQRASASGNPVNLFIVGDGFGAEEIINGNYLLRIDETVEHLFSIEPYKSYRSHFNISTSIALSPDNITATLDSRRLDRLGTFGVDLDIRKVEEYVTSVSDDIDYENLRDAFIIVLSNLDAFVGESCLLEYDRNIACIALPEDCVYPYDRRGLVLRYAGGEAFAGLGKESVTHFEHIKSCTCPYCGALTEYMSMKERGLFGNITMSSKMSDAPWSQFIFHSKYSSTVDMWEGGYGHVRGVWRSEPQSVMSTYIPYYNTISRYAIYKEIMRRAGLPATLDDFIANDKIEIPLQ